VTGAAGRPLPTWLACSGCGQRIPDAAPLVLACPAARPGDDVDHVLVRGLDAASAAFDVDEDATHPYLRWRRRFHAYHRARALGWSDDDFAALVTRLDRSVGRLAGSGFVVSPFSRVDGLSDALGFAAAGGVWVKDETVLPSGSHKGRHLFGTLLGLEVEAARVAAAAAGEPPPPPAPLAIASCGNAALAAAVVARAAGRHLEVFVPPDAEEAILEQLEGLGAAVRTCQRRPGVAGDPTYQELLRAVAAGAVPFTCQGNLNGLAIEGGSTLGWELASAVGAPGGPARLDRLVVQVGGGALLSSILAGFGDDAVLGQPVALPRIHAVQPAGVHPLERAWALVRADVEAGLAPAAALAAAARRRSSVMWPWEGEPRSVAHGIIDDETYDWRACVAGMLESGGGPLVVSEAKLEEANALARSTTGIDVDHTGSAGLAGLLDLVRARALRADETVAVLFTGAVRRRPAPARGDHPVKRAAHRRRHSQLATSGGS